MKKTLLSIFQALGILLLAAELVEFFFAGTGVFQTTSFQIHRTMGGTIWFATLLLLLLSLICKMGRKTVGL